MGQVSAPRPARPGDRLAPEPHWGVLRQQLMPRLQARAMHAYRRYRASPEAPWGQAVTLYHEGLDPALLDRWAAHYLRHSVWAANEAALQPGVAVSSSMLYPDAELKHTEFYDGWLRPQQLFYAVGGVVQQDATSQVKLCLFRPESAEPFGASDLDLVSLLMPHLAGQIDLHDRLHDAQALARAGSHALDAFQTAVLLVGPDDDLRHANATAQALLDRGQPLRLEADRLVCDDPAFAAALHSRVLARIHLDAAAVVVVNAPEQVRQRDHVVRIVIVNERGRDVERFAAAHGFTRAEQQVFGLLLQGHSPKDISQLRHSAYNTVRSQIAALLVKSGCRSQRELLALFQS